MVVIIFFFQAEDGIRDLVRSRGLGDVYKRQEQTLPGRRVRRAVPQYLPEQLDGIVAPRFGESAPVSYTHLTLPTSDLV